jgi:hypothetical protein
MVGAWSPQKGPQADACEATWVDELLFGGARGGGKSDYLLGDYLQDVPKYGRHWQGILFRRTYPELAELVQRSHSVFPQTEATWREKDRDWTWPNGARLRMRYLEYTRDASRYQGHAYPWQGWDELTQWPTADGYNQLKACLRWAEADVPTKRIRATANPGGPGHMWVKKYFIDHNPLGLSPLDDSESGMTRMFIRSKVQDNKILLERDPLYINRLKGVGSPELVRAWLDGDWDAITGAYFPEFSLDKHVVKPFRIPAHWSRFRAGDWGSFKPFGFGWFAVSDGYIDKNTVCRYPAGSLIMYREWYGAPKDENGQLKPNVGLKMPPKDVGKGVLSRTGQGENISYTVLDPACWKEDGGPSIAEQMRKAGLPVRPADNARVAGWNAVRGRLVGEVDEYSYLDREEAEEYGPNEKFTPLLYFFTTCTETIRTLPALQHDEKKVEDADTRGDDHMPDMVRYACMSRPSAATYNEPVKGKTLGELTLNDLWEIQEGIDRQKKTEFRREY